MASFGLDNYDDEDEGSPYDSISSRAPVAPISAAPNIDVKNFIAQKMATPKRVPLEEDPLMQQYFRDKSEMDDLRHAKLGADTQSNMLQAASQFAQGTNTPKDNGVAARIAAQNQEIISESDKDQTRKQKVMEAIEARRSKSADRQATLSQHADTEKGRREDRALTRKLIEQKSARTNTDIKLLPAEDQEVVKDLAKKNASKIAIANQIDAVINKWDSLSEDQQLKQGQQLLKVLNSTEGADAIGAEEAKRLGSRLEFAVGNFTNSNPMQFGRNLKGFAEDARITSQGIKNAIKANDSEIAKRYNRVGIHREPGIPVEQENPKSQKVVVSNGKETLEIDPSDLADAEKDGYKRM
jgi:hypothetical protein